MGIRAVPVARSSFALSMKGPFVIQTRKVSKPEKPKVIMAPPARPEHRSQTGKTVVASSASLGSGVPDPSP